MPDQFAHVSEEAKQAREAVNNATDHGQRALNEALAAAERTIASATKAFERLLKDSVDTLRAQTGTYADEARQHFEQGQQYVTEQVKERPLTFTVAGLGVGLLLGLLLSTRANAK
jgi:ElaB/YqjD/DUF883 family membrane-anchored ribosome-binding protein